jgi:nucleoside-diphosphate-sugar epimerase
MPPSTILVTGATGFIGRGLMPALGEKGFSARALARGIDLREPGDLAPALAGVSAVVHLAARAHVLHEGATDPLAEFRAVNRDATIRLAESAVRAGVRRFIFVSSIGVLGESTDGIPFGPASLPAPVAPYALSKWEAEQRLRELASATGLEVAIIRPPLVHGPGAPGNFARLLGLVARGIPLPFGAVRGRRTFVSRANLASLIVATLKHPVVPAIPLLAGDKESLTLPELLQTLGEGMGRPVRLIPFPGLGLARTLPLIGKGVRKLTDSLEVDIAATCTLLGWSPVESAQDGLRQMARAWREGR